LNVKNATFAHEHDFANPLQRLIMIRILMAGSMDGEGERIIPHKILTDFCCCSSQALLIETNRLERAGHLAIRLIGDMSGDLVVHRKAECGYTITPQRGQK